MLSGADGVGQGLGPIPSPLPLPGGGGLKSFSSLSHPIRLVWSLYDQCLLWPSSGEQKGHVEAPRRLQVFG